MPKLKIIFMGTPAYAARYVDGLIAAGLKPVALITQPDRPAGRGQTEQPPPVKRVAEKHGIPVYQPENIRDAQWTKKIHELAPELIIVVAFGQIIPQSILDIPPRGCINVHPSLLPRHRGATPWQETIMQGDTKTGVTIMLMDEKMDHGPILAQEEVDVMSDETTPSLENKTANVGIPLLIQTIHQWTHNEITPREQEHEKATYTRLLNNEMGRIDWSEDDKKIEQLIRALNPWPGTGTEWKGKHVKILRAHLKDGALVIDELQPEGKKPMDKESFVNGYIRQSLASASDARFLASLGMT